MDNISAQSRRSPNRIPSKSRPIFNSNITTTHNPPEIGHTSQSPSNHEDHPKKEAQKRVILLTQHLAVHRPSLNTFSKILEVAIPHFLEQLVEKHSLLPTTQMRVPAVSQLNPHNTRHPVFPNTLYLAGRRSSVTIVSRHDRGVPPCHQGQANTQPFGKRNLAGTVQMELLVDGSTHHCCCVRSPTFTPPPSPPFFSRAVGLINNANILFWGRTTRDACETLHQAHDRNL